MGNLQIEPGIRFLPLPDPRFRVSIGYTWQRSVVPRQRHRLRRRPDDSGNHVPGRVFVLSERGRWLGGFYSWWPFGSRWSRAGRTVQADMASPIVAEEAPYTLEELTSLADEFNPILTRDQAQIDFARGQALQASLYPNPVFDPLNPQVFAGRNSQFAAGATQQIVVKGKKQLDTAAAQKVVHQSEIAFAQDRFALLGGVRVQYFRVLAAQKRVEVLTQLRNIVKQALETGKNCRKPATWLASIRFSWISTCKKLRPIYVSRKTCSTAIARSSLPSSAYPACASPCCWATWTLACRSSMKSTLRMYVATQHTAIRLANLDVDRNRILLRRAEVEPWPNPVIGPAYAYGFLPNNDQFWLYVQCPIPVWDRNQGNIQSAAAGIRTATENMRTIQNDLIRQVAEVLSQHALPGNAWKSIATRSSPT